MKKYTIYTIKYEGQVVYVGVSVDFERRKYQHLRIGTNISAIPSDVDIDKVEIIPIKEYKTKKAALKEEDRLIRKYDTINNGWNKERSGLVSKDKKRYNRQYCQKYREDHRAEYNAYKRQYMRKYREEHKAENRDIQRKYREAHRNEWNEYQRQYQRQYRRKKAEEQRKLKKITIQLEIPFE